MQNDRMDVTAQELADAMLEAFPLETELVLAQLQRMKALERVAELEATVEDLSTGWGPEPG